MLNMKRHELLVIDDDGVIRLAIRKYLEDGGYTVFTASNGTEAMNLIRIKRLDMILLDRGLPDAEGLDLISGIRKHSSAPIIVISSKDTSVDKVVGLEIGADNYLTKPLQKTELLAHVKAGIRRFQEGGKIQEMHTLPLTVRFGKWTMDCGQYQVFDDSGGSADLTTSEFRMLEALVRNAGRVMTRSQLLETSHPENLNVTDRAIDIQISRIRTKMRADSPRSDFIKTVRGIGYIFDRREPVPACRIQVDDNYTNNP